MQHNEKSRQETLKQVTQELARAIWLSDTPQIIANLSKLAHCALESGHVSERDVTDRPEAGSADMAMKLVFDTVKHCTAGKLERYTELYGLCTEITHKLLKAKHGLDAAIVIEQEAAFVVNACSSE